ncbi:hypothetical protein G3O00_09540 [Burkholderia sp. Ac-20384]|uniref:hypothetical protein n=1 Tax=Burkholderia sp. Ac-20384 TaxID=2703902 RepID=UPI0019822B9F|nr:hypothetical protein [Burkholderia sp. Ac-20384]MBN3823857.1 hypothetical protein [Burkholderia sp. Ac-20384]
MTTGHKLAELVFDKSLLASDPDVANVERVLHDASSRMIEPENHLADAAWVFTKELRKDGIRESGVDAMEACSRVADRLEEKVEFASCGAHYVVTRHSGMSHTDAVLGLVGLARVAKAISSEKQN